MKSERGAVAVEMALVLPILILLLLGIMEFGRAFNAQVMVTNAAREGVRVMAIGRNDAAAQNAAVRAADLLNPDIIPANVLITRSNGGAVNTCATGATATVNITYSLSTLTGIAGPFTLKGKGVMLCGG